MTVSLELLSRGPSRPDLLEDLVADESGLAATLARWAVPAPAAVAPDPETGLPGSEVVAVVLARGAAAVVDVAPGLAGAGPAVDPLVGRLAGGGPPGVRLRAGLGPPGAGPRPGGALLAGAVAAMTGGDVRAALAAPDPDALLALPRAAREAIRDVVTCVIVPSRDVDEVSADLASAHLP